MSRNISKGNVFVILLAILALVGVGVVIYLFWLSQQLKPQPMGLVINNSASPAGFQTPANKDETANWKQYVNEAMQFNLLYPPDKNFQVSGDLSNNVFIMVPQSDYGLVISKHANPTKVMPRQWFADNFTSLTSGTEVNGKKLSPADFTVSDTTLGGQPAIRVTGPVFSSSIYVLKPTKDYIVEIKGDTLGQNLLQQILATFQFGPP